MGELKEGYIQKNPVTMTSRYLLRQIFIVLLSSFCLVSLIMLIIRWNFMDHVSFLTDLTQKSFRVDFEQEISANNSESTNELDGCYHIFLDVGSNIGNTVRKYSLLVANHS